MGTGSGGWAPRSGFETLDDQEFASSGSGSGQVFSFYIKDPPKSKRVIFLDDDPAIAWVHNLYSLTKRMTEYVCLVKNGIGDSCPLCDLDKDLQEATKGGKDKKGCWPTMVGFFTVLDCGVVERNPTTRKLLLKGDPAKKGDAVYQFQRLLLRASRGSKDKPGMLPEFRRLKEANGNRLTGLMFEAHRSGQKTEGIGDKWGRVMDPAGEADLTSDDALREYLCKIEGSPAKEPTDQILKFVKAEPVNYIEGPCVPMSLADLAKLADGLRIQNGLSVAGSGGNGGGGGDTGHDPDNVPF